MHHPRPAYAGIAILLSMLIAIAIGLYLLVMPVKSQNPQGAGGQGGQGGQGSGTTSYLGQIQQGRQSGNRLACAQQCRSVAQMITVVEAANLGARSGPQDTFELLDAFRADGSYALLPFNEWNSDAPADPPIVYVPERERGTSGVLFYEHPDNHNGAGGHVAFDGGGVRWFDWNEFVTLTSPLPQPTW
ncbi:MAG: hypothetical protein Tsb0013_22380 [Phycisphaerales bacterium]